MNLKDRGSCHYHKAPILEILGMEECKEREFLNSRMELFMMDSTKIIRSMELENIIKTERPSKENGKMGIATVRDFC